MEEKRKKLRKEATNKGQNPGNVIVSFSHIFLNIWIPDWNSFQVYVLNGPVFGACNGMYSIHPKAGHGSAFEFILMPVPTI